MISKRLYINIIIRLCLITGFSILLGFFIFREQSLRLSLFCLLIIIILTFSLVSYLNRTNRNIRFFFDSVRNDDSNLTFPVDSKSGSLRELHMSMNNVNHQIQQLKLENRQQEHYFQKILEHLATGIITYNNKGFILHVNSAAKGLLSTDVLTHLHQIERIDRNLYRVVKSIKPLERQLVAINTKLGETQLLLKATSFGQDGNELMILSLQDIKHELDEKEIDSWMRLIRVLMHEIMNSIAPITSLSQSLSDIYCPDEKPVTPEKVTDKTISVTLQGLKVIREQGKGLMSFVDSYRKLTHIPKPEMKLFKVSGLFSRVKILTDSLEKEKNAEIIFQVDNPELGIFADENLISLVLINLIKNALEANENNPDCVIRVTAGTAMNHSVEICVIDNGPGISSQNLDEIFIPFFTTREKGSGIGLSISKQIMGAHGGRLKARSKPDDETVFCMSFRN